MYVALVTGLYVIIVILSVLLFGFGMWYYAKHGHRRNGEKHMVAPNSPNSIVHPQHEGNFQVDTGLNSDDPLNEMEGTDAVGAGPGATNENVIPAQAQNGNKNNNDMGSMDVDDIVNMDDLDMKEDGDDDIGIIQEIETLQGPKQSDYEDDIDIETMG